jgi:hypothetical protein
MTVTVTPVNPPINIPATGGTFGYGVTITNTSPITLVYDAWVTVDLPTGTEYEILVRMNLSLPAGGTLTRNLTQTVPGTAPAGLYNNSVEIGQYPLYLDYDEDGFTFTKSAGYDFNSAEGNWNLAGFDEEVPALASSAPHDYTIFSNYPNPFNAKTTITFEITEASRVKLCIYSIEGKLVAKLLDGYEQSGTQQITFDAGDLASGIYFATLSVGNMSQTQKLLLIK